MGIVLMVELADRQVRIGHFELAGSIASLRWNAKSREGALTDRFVGCEPIEETSAE